MSTRYELAGADVLIKALQAKGNTNWEKITQKNLLEMRDRAITSSNPAVGGTPVDTSELRQSASVDFNASGFGYTKDYAPHVEFGHREFFFGMPTGGFVPGQFFLKNNLRIQNELYRHDLAEEMRKGD